MKEFFIQNWQFIVMVAFAVIDFFILLFRKKITVKLDPDVYSDCLENIPFWINEAEKEYGSGHGQEKFNYVFRAALSFICEELGYSVNSLPGSLLKGLREYIEDVLSTPTKKEVSNNEKR